MDYREVLPRDTFLDGKYRIERVLGAGGFGITYEAVDIGLDMPVAIKEYYPTEFALRDQTQTVRPRSEKHKQVFDHLKTSFLREAQTLAQFDDPAIVRVISVFSSHGTAYMVMRYEVGPNLKAWLAQLGRPPTQGELDRILVNLLRALEVMHGRDFLHRDIATDNIILRSDGDPVLLDFGSSRRVVAETTGTLTGVVKQGFSPPEQYSVDSKGQGPWTDIYALAATLYRCVTGKMPPEGTTRMLEDDYVPARDAAQSSYRSTFLDAIDWALNVYPKDRPQNVGDWRAALFEGTGLEMDGIFSTPNGITSDPLVVIGDDRAPNSRQTGPASSPRSFSRQTGGRPSAPLASDFRASRPSTPAPARQGSIASSTPLADVTPAPRRGIATRIAVAAVILTVGSFAMIAVGSESASVGMRQLVGRLFGGGGAATVGIDAGSTTPPRAEADRQAAQRVALEAQNRAAREEAARRQAAAEAAARQRQQQAAQAEAEKRKAAEAAERQRLAALEEAERRQQAAAEAERQRLAAAAAAETKRRADAEAERRRQAELAAAAAAAAAAEAEKKRQAEAASRRQRRAQVLTSNQQQDFVREIQLFLREHNCYSGEVTGKADDVKAGLETLRQNDASAPTVDLVKSTLGEAEDWLDWMEQHKKRLCPGPSPEELRARERAKQLEAERERKLEEQNAAREEEKKRQREAALQRQRDEEREAREEEKRRQREAARRREREEEQAAAREEARQQRREAAARRSRSSNDGNSGGSNRRSSGGGGGGGVTIRVPSF